MKLVKLVLILSLVVSAYGCATFAYTNNKITQHTKTMATCNIDKDRGTEQKTLVILSLSGGGSRSAYFSASVMLALENVFDELNILKEVDIISSVSGGSLPAAYYVISKEPDDESNNVISDRNWDRDTVLDLMSRNYRGKWLGNFFWPTNFVKYWFTAFDRSDLMAQTFADNMFDRKSFGGDLKFKDINPDRPYIVLNSTNGTTDEFSKVFRFTQEEFEENLQSDINEYEVARAVMATASFPAIFNYMTLKNYSKSDNEYVHVFDGGNSDNLGLGSVEKIIDLNQKKYGKIVIILVDAYTASKGVSAFDYDGRKPFDYAVDLNFIDSFDSLLSINRDKTINHLTTVLNSYSNQHEIVFYHIKFNDIRDTELRKKLNSIRTDFKINSKAEKAIDEAVKQLIVKENKCLQEIKEILLESTTNHKNTYCAW